MSFITILIGGEIIDVLFQCCKGPLSEMKQSTCSDSLYDELHIFHIIK